MNERPDPMTRALTVTLLFVAALTAGFGGFTAYLLGAERVWVLALILCSAVALSMLAVSISFPIRAYRRGEDQAMKQINEIHHHGTTETQKIYYGEALPNMDQPARLARSAISVPTWGVTGGGQFHTMPAGLDAQKRLTFSTSRPEQPERREQPAEVERPNRIENEDYWS